MELGGRTFHPVSRSTAEWDRYVMQRIRRAKLDEVEMREGEDAEAFARRIMFDIIDSNVEFELYGAFLMPEGVNDVDWTPEIALRTAGFTRRLDDPEDKGKLSGLLLVLIANFFEHGLISVTDSRTSSRGQPGAPAMTKASLASGPMPSGP